MNLSVRPRLAALQATLLPVLDIVDERVEDAQIPGWCARRDWSGFLLSLTEAELERSEAEGLAVTAPQLSGIPESLAKLAAEVREQCRLPALVSPPLGSAKPDFRGVSLRKRQQLSSLLGALGPLVASAGRIVDVGAGSGHFTRLSAEHFGCETLGLEQNPERVARATSRARTDTDSGLSRGAHFAVIDAVREPLELRSDDLAIGLHACGELGDTLVRVVAERGCDLALISCCLQKINSSERSALSQMAGGFSLRKETLGLSNLTSQAMGVEASIETTLRAREARYALRLLLRGRGLDIEAGAEMRGINRRRAHSGLADIAERALTQRALPSASDAEVRAYEAEAAKHFYAVRRLSLPRNLLARAIELCVILDRAGRLEESGHSVRIATLFERAVTPRNISLFASRDATRLPALRTS